MLNFITVQFDYGGNVYLSADEGLTRQYGEYVGMVNYKKKAATFTLTANGKWDNTSQLNAADNSFMLNDGVLHQSVYPLENKTQANSQYLNFKFAHASRNHSFNIALALTRSATPQNMCVKTDANYGVYQSLSRSLSYLKCRNISISLTYILQYGKKT